jgi:hypothetical protein
MQPQPKPGPPPACPRLRHEWARDGGRGVGLRCKRCPAVGVVCPDCDGRREIDDVSSFYKIPCPRCGATGIVEVVEITAAEVEILRRDQNRLNIADELWRMESKGESGLRAAHGAREQFEDEDTGEFPALVVDGG